MQIKPLPVISLLFAPFLCGSPARAGDGFLTANNGLGAGAAAVGIYIAQIATARPPSWTGYARDDEDPDYGRVSYRLGSCAASDANAVAKALMAQGQAPAPAPAPSKPTHAPEGLIRIYYRNGAAPQDTPKAFDEKAIYAADQPGICINEAQGLSP